MYARNYSEILRSLDANGLSLASFQNDSRFSEIMANVSTEISKCTNGWNYDRQMFPNTVVMQVYIWNSKSELRQHFSSILIYYICIVGFSLWKRLLHNVCISIVWCWWAGRKLFVWLSSGLLGPKAIVFCVFIFGNCRVCIERFCLELRIMANISYTCRTYGSGNIGQSICSRYKTNVQSDYVTYK